MKNSEKEFFKKCYLESLESELKNHEYNQIKKENYRSIIEQVMRISNKTSPKANDRIGALWSKYLVTDDDAYKTVIENERSILESAEKVLKSEKDSNEFAKNVQDLKTGSLKQYLLPKLHSEASKKIKEEKLLNIFQLNSKHEAVVVSIDIRDSTQLMLNAKKPELFAEFITDVTEKLFEIIKENFGILDKFTGDGLLCFFPKNYSGEDAIYYALKASVAAHKLFETEYKKHYDKFSVVKADVGLGIGIDYGKVYFTPVCQEPTIVGIPVVYACRLSAAPAYHTYLNQPAFELVEKKYKNLYSVNFCTISFKNQGSMIAYDLNLNFDAIDPKKPDWQSNQENSNV